MGGAKACVVEAAGCGSWLKTTPGSAVPERPDELCWRGEETCAKSLNWKKLVSQNLNLGLSVSKGFVNFITGNLCGP